CGLISIVIKHGYKEKNDKKGGQSNFHLDGKYPVAAVEMLPVHITQINRRNRGNKSQENTVSGRVLETGTSEKYGDDTKDECCHDPANRQIYHCRMNGMSITELIKCLIECFHLESTPLVCCYQGKTCQGVEQLTSCTCMSLTIW